MATALSAASCGGSCNNEFAPDSCARPGQVSATSIELGQSVGGEFTALSDGEVMPLVYGPQGGAMIGVMLRVRGDVPSCLEQATAAYRLTDGEEIDIDRSPRVTYDASGGARYTREIFLIMRDYLASPGDAVRVVTMVGAQSAERIVFLDHVGQTDAAVPDAGPPDAAPADDAAPDDAAPGGDAAMLDAS